MIQILRRFGPACIPSFSFQWNWKTPPGPIFKSLIRLPWSCCHSSLNVWFKRLGQAKPKIVYKFAISQLWSIRLFVHLAALPLAGRVKAEARPLTGYLQNLQISSVTGITRELYSLQQETRQCPVEAFCYFGPSDLRGSQHSLSYWHFTWPFCLYVCLLCKWLCNPGGAKFTARQSCSEQNVTNQNVESDVNHKVWIFKTHQIPWIYLRIFKPMNLYESLIFKFYASFLDTLDLGPDSLQLSWFPRLPGTATEPLPLFRILISRLLYLARRCFF